jgi:hypothetical protein
MATSLLPELGTISVAGAPGKGPAIALRQRCEVLRAQMEGERATFLSHWRDLGDFILPRRARFWVTDVNRGDRRSQKIIDSTATTGARTLSSGMMANLTSPAQPWFALTTPDDALNEVEGVKEYLYECGRRMMLAFARSNLYQALPIVYSDVGVFATGAMMQLDDDEHVFRFYTFPIGSYALANDSKQRVRTFLRTFRLTVQQVVEKWGDIDESGRPGFVRNQPTALSLTVQNLWRNGQRQTWIDLVHVIQPNLAYDGRKIESRFKRFESIYYEAGAPNQPVDAAANGVLAHEGFDEFPLFCPRWEVNSEDVYGTNCPGMTALGDIRQLQTGERRKGQAIEKQINPPMIAPSSARAAKLSVLPGDITYLDTTQQGQGFHPAYEVKFDSTGLTEWQNEVRDRIKDAFFVDLFLMMSQSDRRDITAREVDERHEEKLLALGPMLEQMNQDLFDPLIERSYNIMLRKGLLPPEPPEMQGHTFADLKVDYKSIMAQAQKMARLAVLERFASFVGQAAQFDPTVVDNIDPDQLVEQYADMTGIPPKIVRSKDAVAAMRDARQKAAAQQQAAENAPKLAGAVQSLSQSPTTGNNALSTLVGKTRARQTMAAGAGPPPTGLPS